MRRVIAVDMGGTNIRAACVDEHGEILSRHTLPTPATAPVAVGFDALVRAIEAARTEAGSEIGAICVACPGPLNTARGTIEHPPQLPYWRGTPLEAMLTAHFRLPATIINDASAAALGEWSFGEGRGTQHMIYIIAGTGIGGGAVAHGRLIEGRSGMGLEFGHTCIMPDGPLCGCGLYGCIEAYSAGAGMTRRAYDAIARGDGAAILAAAGDNEITGAIVAHTADAGDPAAQQIIVTGGTILGIGVANLIHLFDPERVVIGGGLTNMSDRYWSPFRAAVAAHTLPPFAGVGIVFSGLGDNAGLLGAASRALALG